MEHPLSTAARYISRDRGTPSAADFAAAGYATEDGSVTRGPDFGGLASEFGIVGRAYDKASGKMLMGRFLVQHTEMEGEVLHHAYKVRS